MKARGLFWVSLFTLALVVPPQASASNDDDDLEVVDADGKRVGTVIGFAPQHGLNEIATPVVKFRAAGHPVVVLASVQGFAQFDGSWGMSVLHWTTSNCTGVPVFGGELPSPGFYPETFLLDQRAYAPVGQVQPYTLRAYGTGPSNCVSFPPETVNTVAVRFVADLGARFTPPFHIR